ncbi:MAG: efflux RND transporter periplasmic adaptor subunit [Acidobacteriota bacterium]
MKWMWSLALIAGLEAQSLSTVAVTAKPVERFVTLTAEIAPYQATAVMARIAGYLRTVEVDRGSVVKAGQRLASIEAPEWAAQAAEARAQAAAFAAQTTEARARLQAAGSTARRLKLASQTAGAVAANELLQAEEAVRAGEAAVAALDLSREAALARLKAIEEMAAYLTVLAPFDGVITERMLHPGGMVGPGAGPIVQLEQLGRLRVVVAVPENYTGSVKMGQRVNFVVSAAPGETFGGIVSRAARTLEPVTRTMAVELEAANGAGTLAPGMYAEVKWPLRSAQNSLLVPVTAVASNTERTFVIKVEQGKARYVSVRRGAVQGELVEVNGALAEGDRVIQRATDEIREGVLVPGR